MSLTCPSDAVSRNRGESNLYLPQLKCNYLEDLVEKKETRRKTGESAPPAQSTGSHTGLPGARKGALTPFPRGPQPKGCSPQEARAASPGCVHSRRAISTPLQSLHTGKEQQGEGNVRFKCTLSARRPPEIPYHTKWG